MPNAAESGAVVGPPVTRLRPVAVAVALLGWSVDQLTKWWALTHLREGHPEPHLGGLLTWNLLFNSGAAFSLGSGATEIFSGLAIVASIVVAAVVIPRVRQWWTAVAAGLALAGITGNLTDRLFRPPAPLRGEVVDFIQIPHWAVFNVADMMLTAVMVLVIGTSVVGMIREARNPAPAAEESPPAQERPPAQEPPPADKPPTAAEKPS